MPIPQIQSPYAIVMRWFVDHEPVVRSKMDMAIHHRLDAPAPGRRVSDWVFLVREEARSRAIHAMWGAFPHCRTRMQVLNAAEKLAETLNPFVIGAEQAEFEREFRKEVYAHLDAMTGVVK